MLCLELISTFSFDLDAINIFQWQSNSYIVYCFLLGKCCFQNSPVYLIFFPDKVGNQLTDWFSVLSSCSPLLSITCDSSAVSVTCCSLVSLFLGPVICRIVVCDLISCVMWQHPSRSNQEPPQQIFLNCLFSGLKTSARLLRGKRKLFRLKSSAFLLAAIFATNLFFFPCKKEPSRRSPSISFLRPVTWKFSEVIPPKYHKWLPSIPKTLLLLFFLLLPSRSLQFSTTIYNTLIWFVEHFLWVKTVVKCTIWEPKSSSFYVFTCRKALGLLLIRSGGFQPLLLFTFILMNTR